MKNLRLASVTLVMLAIATGCSAPSGELDQASASPRPSSSLPTSNWEINDLTPFAGHWSFVETRDAGEPIPEGTDILLTISADHLNPPHG